MRAIDNNQKLSQELKKVAQEQGFNPVGIARVPGSHRLQLRTAALQRWLEVGYQAEMKWMAAPRRQMTTELLEGVNSVLAVGLNYYINKPKNPGTLSVARYAWGKDYHKVIKQRLKHVGNWLEEKRPGCRWKICVDSTPLMDKAWAEEAGLGWIGKHSNLINQHQGSWMAIGHLLCTEPLIPDTPAKPLCGRCQECIKACPTQAITEPFVVNSKRCLAYHTIENRNPELPQEITSAIGSWIAGCDICQEICPWNLKTIPSSDDPEMQPNNWLLELTKVQALSLTDEEWATKLGNSALKRIKPWMWRRNASAIQDQQTPTLHKH